MSRLHELHILFLCNIFFAHQSLGGRVHQINQEENAGVSTDTLSSVKFHLPYIDLPSKNGGTIQPYVAVHIIEDRERGYYGITTTFDVYGYNLKDGQATGAAIQINNFVGDYSQNFSEIAVGWVVWPSYFNDSKTYFFTTWTKDSHQSTGCVNLDCPGLQLLSGSPIFPGDVLAPVSQANGAPSTIEIKLIKDKAKGDWTLLAGFNDHLEFICYFPASLFDGKFTKATQIVLGGHALKSETTSAPPMGSGAYPDSKKAAGFANIAVYDKDGQPGNITFDVPVHDTDAKLYFVTPITEHSEFHYGGPGRNI